MDQLMTASAATPARRLYEALAGGDRDVLDEVLHPDFVGLLADGMPGAVGGQHVGPAAMRRDGWGAIARDFEVRAEPEQYLMTDDGRLLVTGRYTGSGRRGGGAVDAPFAHLLTLTDGRISRLEQYTDTARWVTAAPPLRALSLEVTDGVATVRMDRPGHSNAIDDVMGRELLEVADRLASDRGVRVVLLGGNGAMFSAGGDIDLFSSTPAPELPGRLRSMIDDYHLAIERLTEIDAPVVAVVRGAAAGGGLGLVCAADFVVAAEDAVFTLGYSGIGLTADGGNSWYLPRLVGMRRAQEMFLLNRRLTAAEALEWGLVSRVVPADAAEQEGAEMAARLASGPTRAFGGVRRLLRQSLETGLRDQLAAERASIVETSATADAREGIAAFSERRRPHFTGQ